MRMSCEPGVIASMKIWLLSSCPVFARVFCTVGLLSMCSRSWRHHTSLTTGTCGASHLPTSPITVWPRNGKSSPPTPTTEVSSSSPVWNTKSIRLLASNSIQKRMPTSGSLPKIILILELLLKTPDISLIGWCRRLLEAIIPLRRKKRRRRPSFITTVRSTLPIFLALVMIRHISSKMFRFNVINVFKLFF
uniref:Uncharacterized protein n=1 Tax=Cacopsylla melanoneura TaxID=428564 RepID=A0A8D8Z796_9HEMI